MTATPSERPNLERKRNLAKTLLKSIKAGDEHSASRMTWYHPRYRGMGASDVLATQPTLADCQLTVAKESGFDSWARLKSCVDQLDLNPGGPVARFEEAVRCIIHGELQQLNDVLQTDPELATARSTRSHNGVLPHYVAANGVENEHQKTPANIVAIAEALFAAGADAVVDATCTTYGGGGGSTPLVGLVTSCHPAEAGCQTELVRVFCTAGANVNGIDQDGLPLACALAFRYPAAAQALHDCGAQVDNLIFAAALGLDDLVAEFLRQPLTSWRPMPNPFPNLSDQQKEPARIAEQAFVYTCMADQFVTAKALLDFGVDINAGPVRGQTALHEAAYQGNLAMVRFLLEQGADKTIRDGQWKSTPAEWASWHGHSQVVSECS